MKIKVNKLIIEEVEISFPYFFATGINYCALLSEDNAIILTFSHVSTDKRLFNSAEYVLAIQVDIEKVEITSQEFFQKYDKVNNEFKQTIKNYLQ